MKFIRGVFLFSVFVVGTTFLSGCGGAGSTPGALESLRENPVLQNAARAALSGKIYDRAAIAIRNRDEKSLEKVTGELAKIDPLAAAEQLVGGALWLDSRVGNETDSKLKKVLENQATQKYRQALKITPDFPSRNAVLLNALGYFLADRGTTRADFQNAEKFTRAALKLLDAEIAEIAKAPLSGPLLSLKKFERAHGARDSLAWALFRQQKFDAARKEQIAAINEAKSNETGPQKISADLYFHLAEIERTLKNNAAAIANYQAALKIDPDHAPSLQGLLPLTGSTPKAKTPGSSPSAPQTPIVPQESIPENALRA